MHSLLFATYVVRAAQKANVDEIVMQTALAYVILYNLNLFSICSYGSHMASDLVGFYADGGYLSNGIVTRYGDVNWITMWPKMSAIDR